MLLTSSTPLSSIFFFFNDTATTEIYTLSLHDALPISSKDTAPPTTQTRIVGSDAPRLRAITLGTMKIADAMIVPTIIVESRRDRKSTRLNSSHSQISYAVFCLKKKKKTN